MMIMPKYSNRQYDPRPLVTPKASRRKPRSVSPVGGGQAGFLTGMGTGTDR